MTGLVPDKLFVNLYPKTIGPCVGAAYLTKEDADKYSNSHRLLCVELGARVATSVVLSETGFARVVAISANTGKPVAWVIEAGVEIQRAIPRETYAMLARYAADHGINLATAIAECCRGYLSEAMR